MENVWKAVEKSLKGAETNHIFEKLYEVTKEAVCGR